MTEDDRMIAKMYRDRGYPNIAKYIEEYGEENLDYGFTGPSEKWEKFFGRCLKEGHTWDYYHKYNPNDLY